MQYEKIISLREYARLAHMIDSNSTKREIGINAQILGNKMYIFYYYGFNDYDIIKVIKMG